MQQSASVLRLPRREFVRSLTGAGLAGGLFGAETEGQPLAVQAGDVVPGRAIVWVRSAFPAGWSVTWRASGGKTGAGRSGELTAATDFTGRVELSGLPPSSEIRYQVALAGSRKVQLEGRFRSAPGGAEDVRFLWSGDMVGQGWGISPGTGIRIFDVMSKLEPHFFLHSGDTIYADGPVPAQVKLPDGNIWKNIVTSGKSKVAETLDEFRGCYRYNLLDQNVQRFSASVAQLWQWDDHEFTNNWSPSKDLSADPRYTVKDTKLLLERARQAFLEYAPMRLSPAGQPRIYRRIPYGPLLDVFVVDMRSFRGPNTGNRQPGPSPETAFLGSAQLEWLQRELQASKAVWKVIAADMPIGLIVGDGKDAQGRPQFENAANGDGPALGRELEIAALLRYIRANSIRDIVWLTADVHYTAAHYYDPARAQFTDFNPFWEFVSGPLNAGTFGPGQLDNTFGPEVMYQKAPPPGQANLSPAAGLQFFGDVRINGRTREMTVTLRDLTGAGLYSKALAPERG